MTSPRAPRSSSRRVGSGSVWGASSTSGSSSATSKRLVSAPGRSNPSGRPRTRRWMGGHVELVVDQLDDVGEHRLGAGRAVGARGPLLVAVGEAGLVAVVAVGDDHRVVGHRSGDGRGPSRVVDQPQGVGDAVVAAQEATGAWSSSSSSDRPGAGDRPHTADRLAWVARMRCRRSDLALGVVCSWGRMPPSPGRDSSRAPNTPVVWCGPVRAVGGHAVHVERRRVAAEHPLGQPAVEPAPGLP